MNVITNQQALILQRKIKKQKKFRMIAIRSRNFELIKKASKNIKELQTELNELLIRRDNYEVY